MAQTIESLYGTQRGQGSSSGWSVLTQPRLTSALRLSRTEARAPRPSEHEALVPEPDPERLERLELLETPPRPPPAEVLEPPRNSCVSVSSTAATSLNRIAGVDVTFIGVGDSIPAHLEEGGRRGNSRSRVHDRDRGGEDGKREDGADQEGGAHGVCSSFGSSIGRCRQSAVQFAW